MGQREGGETAVISMQGDDRGWIKAVTKKILVDVAFPNKGGGMSVD